ncbi:uncharacterized protein JCM6883_003114 [Sporobolomyces salmoneus]|uniref:uncharacterized protein n=1 Tax=Sporobolomyces salmoneus TaxID=183962 RepID=UPI0031818D73
MTATLADSVELPCGRRLPNRLVKAAMEELMSGDHLPNENFERLYRAWSIGGFGMLISGNVQVSPKHLGLPLDVAVPEMVSELSQVPAAKVTDRFKFWASSMDTDDSTTRPLRVMQLNHPGRQSMRVLTGRSPFSPALAPSNVPMTAGNGAAGKFAGQLVWGIPKEMTVGDIEEVIEQFRRGAKLAKETGWDGVQLHASHGYLLAQFLSPRTNLRKDDFGGNGRKRLEILLRTADAIRQDHPIDSGFVLGVKLNASDYIKGGLTEDDALENVKWIAQHGGFDFIEISGGSYEAPEFLSMKPSTSRREAFFAEFSSRAYRLLSDELDLASLPTPKPLVLLTGGFRTRSGMRQALETPVSDLIGIGRPAAVDPHFANKILDTTIPDHEAKLPKYDPSEGTTILRWFFRWMTLFGPSLDVFYHNLLMHSIAFGQEPSGEDASKQNSDLVRFRLAPFWTLVRRNYLDSWFSPTSQRLAVWSLIGLLSYLCLARYNASFPK